MKLRVTKYLDVNKTDLQTDDAMAVESTCSLATAVYLEGHVVEPSTTEARVLLAVFPDHFEEVQ